MDSLKFNNLPDIDHLGTDVYETPDPDTSEARYYTEEIQDSQDINSTSISISAASNKFSTLEKTSNPTFRKKRVVRGLPDAEEYTYPKLRAEIEEESVVEKYRRLTLEIQELSEQLKPADNVTIPENLFIDATTGNLVNNSNGKNLVSHTWLIEQVANMQKELAGLGQYAGVGLGLVPDDESTVEQISMYKKLMSDIQTAKQPVQQTPLQKRLSIFSKPSQKDGDEIVYELYYTPELSKQTQLSKLGDLEKRISKLEKLIGAHYVGETDMVVQNNGTLVSALNSLDQLLSILTQPSKLDLMASKIKSLTLQLEKLNDMKKRQIDPEFKHMELQSETERRIEHLYLVMEKLEGVVEVIPNMVTRLRALRQLHSEAAVFADTLSAVKEQVTQVGVGAGTLAQAVDALQSSVTANNDTVARNVAALDSRMQALSERLAKLA